MGGPGPADQRGGLWVHRWEWAALCHEVLTRWGSKEMIEKWKCYVGWLICSCVQTPYSYELCYVACFFRWQLFSCWFPWQLHLHLQCDRQRPAVQPLREMQRKSNIQETPDSNSGLSGLMTSWWLAMDCIIWQRGLKQQQQQQVSGVFCWATSYEES